MKNRNPFVIDWTAQWALHAPGYRDGFLWIDLSQYQRDCSHPPLRLKPGPGFGDLSHPTTNLMIEMMGEKVKDRAVFDIGCGSGILSLCALAFNACSVRGIDIDPLAIEHAKENVVLNQMDSQKITFSFPDENLLSGVLNPLILMNMIWLEQKEAFRNLSFHSGECIISGIHASQEKEYLAFVHQLEWTLLSKKQKEDWLVFHFTH
jgi:ribosomal protein L11 methyltransferase